MTGLGTGFALWKLAHFPVSYITSIVIKAVDMIVFVNKLATGWISTYTTAHGQNISETLSVISIPSDYIEL